MTRINMAALGFAGALIIGAGGTIIGCDVSSDNQAADNQAKGNNPPPIKPIKVDAGNKTTPTNDHRAINSPIIFSLEDNKREIVIKPNLNKLKEFKFDESFRDNCWRELVRIQYKKPQLSPAAISFHFYSYKEKAGVDIKLSELAEVEIRPITFLPKKELKDLAEDIIKQKRDAADRVSQLGGRAKNIIPLLLPHIKTSEIYLRCSCACSALKSIRQHATEAIPMLVYKINTNKNGDESSYARTLASIGEAAIGELSKLLFESKDYRVKDAGASGLIRILPGGLEIVQQAMRHKDSLVRESAAKSLRYEKHDSSTKALMDALYDTDAQVRVEIIYSLAQHGTRAKEAIPALLELLTEKKYQLPVLNAIGNIKPKADLAAPKVLPFLKNKSGKENLYLCNAALVALGQMRVKTKPALLEIKKCLETPELTKKALNALANIGGKEAAIAVKEVAALVNPTAGNVSGYALRALHSMHVYAAPALKELKQAVADGKGTNYAITTLGYIGKPAISALPDMATELHGSYGSYPLPPKYCVRAMAAIDIDAAVLAIKENMKKQVVTNGGLRYHDFREGALLALEYIREHIAKTQAALKNTAETTTFQKETFISPNEGVRGEVSRAIRIGDSLERVIALLGLPDEVTGNTLTFNAESYSLSRDRVGITHSHKIKIIIKNGVVQEKKIINLEPAHKID